MAVRYGIQADTQRECQQALELLCQQLGLEPALPPRLLSDDRWMARAVPTTRAPTASDGGRGSGVSG